MLQFRIQSTPNPNARKYVLKETVKAAGKVSYSEPADCQHVPLAEALLHVEGVTQVHFFENVLTITQNGLMEWGYLDHAVQTLVRNMIGEHDVAFEDQLGAPSGPSRENFSQEMIEIDEILERTIRPSLQMDGGDLELLSYDEGLLSIHYMGACGGCPSSMAGTLQAIKSILRDEFRDDIEVVAT